MNRGEQLSSILERMRKHAGVTSVYGDPVERNGRTIIPVARVAYGFGGGYGSPAYEETQARDEKQDGEGSGVGGGVSATPTGIVEITDRETRFIPFGDRRQLATVAGVSLALGYLLYRSELFPAVLGGLVVLAAFGYLTESFTFFLVPAYEPMASTIVVVTAVIGEMALALYLVVKGVKMEQPATPEAS